MQRIIAVSGAGSGIGQAIAHMLAAQGAAICLIGRRRAALEQTRVTLHQPDLHHLVVADIRDAAALRTGLAALEREMALVPLGKMSRPAEIADFVQFLVRGKQTSITGQTFDINNGAIMPS